SLAVRTTRGKELVHLSASPVAPGEKGSAIRSDEQIDEPLFFRSYVEAATFLKYLSRTENPNQVRDRALLLLSLHSKQLLTQEIVNRLQVEAHKLNGATDSDSKCKGPQLPTASESGEFGKNAVATRVASVRSIQAPDGQVFPHLAHAFVPSHH